VNFKSNFKSKGVVIEQRNPLDGMQKTQYFKSKDNIYTAQNSGIHLSDQEK
jgi:hypothetical protein